MARKAVEVGQDMGAPTDKVQKALDRAKRAEKCGIEEAKKEKLEGDIR